jgi:hypothetical protein
LIEADTVTIRAFQHQKLYEEAIFVNDGLSSATKPNCDEQQSTVGKVTVFDQQSDSNLLHSDQKTELVSHINDEKLSYVKVTDHAAMNNLPIP